MTNYESITNDEARNLKREVEAGHFRQDLYYRLAVIQVVLPPLHKRTEDIPLLVEHFIEQLGAGRDARLQISFSTMEKLKRHRWPGNVRELRNFIERATILAEDGRVESRFLKLGRPTLQSGERSDRGGMLRHCRWCSHRPDALQGRQGTSHRSL